MAGAPDAAIDMLALQFPRRDAAAADGDHDEMLVGDFFQANGDDEDAHNPEDWIQTIAITPDVAFKISLAEDDGAIPGSLFACALWNGAVRPLKLCFSTTFGLIVALLLLEKQRFIAKYFAQHPDLVRHKTVVEFGAASYVTAQRRRL